MSAAERIVTMLPSFVGIAIVALPAGIITAGYMSELEKQDNTTIKKCVAHFLCRGKKFVV